MPENNQSELEKYLAAMQARSASEGGDLGEQESPDQIGASDEAMAGKDFNAGANQDQRLLDQQSQANEAKGGKISAAGDATMAASGGNPYVAAAGLVLKTVGMADDSKRRQEQAKIDQYNKKIMGQRAAVRNMFG